MCYSSSEAEEIKANVRKRETNKQTKKRISQDDERWFHQLLMIISRRTNSQMS